MCDVEHRLLDWLASYGPGVLFCAQMFGIFGLPIPDELLLTVAGALARQGQLSIAPTILAAIAGCTCGITLSYVLGRTVGLTALRKVVHVPDAAFDRAQRWFHRSGGLLLTFGYFIPGVRHCTAIAAGSTPLDYPTFAGFAYPGAVMWCLVFIMLGYYAGSRWRAVLTTAQHTAPLVVVPLVLVAGLVFWMHRQRGQRPPQL
jgi:membrane protein DedA with SNARE-associated domain